MSNSQQTKKVTTPLSFLFLLVSFQPSSSVITTQQKRDHGRSILHQWPGWVRTIFHHLRAKLMLASNPTVYNNSQDSDLVLQCGDHQIYAHRAILRLWSPFFARSLSSQFSVAKSAVFVIDPDDNGDYEPFLGVLMQIYGMPLDQHPYNDSSKSMQASDRLGFYIKAYIMADKYDFPSVRISLVNIIEGHFIYCEKIGIPLGDGLGEHISRICGPNAPQLADPSMRTVLLNWVFENFGTVSEHPTCRAKLKDGTLLDSESAGSLLLELGVCRREHVKRKPKQGCM
jgi:hypothetical protein